MELRFPQETISMDFEVILRKYYYKSGFKKNKTIIFDFTDVVWFGIFELSLISLWIIELADAKKDITVKLPKDQVARKFLIDYGFIECLHANQIKTEENITTKTDARTRNLLTAPFYPLTFFDQDTFISIIDDLYHGPRMDLIFRAVKDSDIVRSGAIRDIVLTELGDNIFIHSETRYANLIMTKHSAISDDKKESWCQSLIRQSTPYEKDFFRELRGEPFLTIVMSDKGHRILDTLISEYNDDNIIYNKKNDPNEQDILQYSFLYHSTSRTLDERLGKIKEVISPEAKKFPPPTGLFRLKEIVREFHGLLYVRSGASIICYNYIKSQHHDNPKSNKVQKQYSNLANFGGNQFKLLFPLEIPSNNIYPIKSIDSQRIVHEETLKRNDAIISLNNLQGSNHLSTLDDQAIYLNTVFEGIERKKAKIRGEYAYLILDLFKNVGLSSKALHYLIYEAMNRQEHNIAILITNADSSILALKNDFTRDKNLLKRLLVIYDESTQAIIFGLSQDENKLIDNALHKQKKHYDEETRKFISRNSHLFMYDESLDKYSFIYTPYRLNSLITIGLKYIIRKIILDEKSFIFHKGIKVLIPDKYYCEGYFEIYRLLSNQTWWKLTISFIRYLLFATKPEFIVTISGHCGKIVNDTLKYLNSIGYELKLPRSFGHREKIVY